MNEQAYSVGAFVVNLVPRSCIQVTCNKNTFLFKALS